MGISRISHREATAQGLTIAAAIGKFPYRASTRFRHHGNRDLQITAGAAQCFDYYQEVLDRDGFNNRGESWRWSPTWITASTERGISRGFPQKKPMG